MKTDYNLILDVLFSGGKLTFDEINAKLSPQKIGAHSIEMLGWAGLVRYSYPYDIALYDRLIEEDKNIRMNAKFFITGAGRRIVKSKVELNYDMLILMIPEWQGIIRGDVNPSWSNR